MRTRTIVLSMLFTAVLLWGCGQDVTEKHYLKLTYAALTFASTKSQPIVVEVSAFPVWKAESKSSWIKVTDQGETSFTVSVEDYHAEQDREGSIEVTCGNVTKILKVHQTGTGAIRGVKYRQLDEFFTAAISPNGKWAGGRYTEYDDNDQPLYYPVIINVETDERVVLGPYPKSVFHLQDVLAITDQGILCVEDGSVGGVVFFTVDEDATRSQQAPGFSGATKIVGSSLDGTVMVGWGTGSPEGHTYGPVKVVDGLYEALPLPELNFRDMEFSQGILARGVSANGEIIYGSTWDDNDIGMVYWDKNGEVHYVGEDVRDVREVTMIDGFGEEYKYNLADGVCTTAGAGNASPSGKWLAGTFGEESLNSKGTEVVVSYYCPAFFNTETQKTIVLDEYKGYGGVSVTDDGIGFTAAVSTGGSGPVFDIENKTVLYDSLADYVKDKYGIIVPRGMRLSYICEEGRALMGSFVTVTAMGPDEFYCYVARNESEK